MISPTNYTIDLTKLQEAKEELPTVDFKLALNQPTGDFFYEPWEIKTEFQGTVWDDILQSLGQNIGEARLIKLEPGTCYHSHSDIDNRWHLTIEAKQAYLVDITSKKIYTCVDDGVWYDMNAGTLHSATNFGNTDRVQLVVRQLLPKNELEESVNVIVTLKQYRPDFRYIFDNTLSPWLNFQANNAKILTNFKNENNIVSFDIDPKAIDNLKALLDPIFEVKVA